MKWIKLALVVFTLVASSPFLALGTVLGYLYCIVWAPLIGGFAFVTSVYHRAGLQEGKSK